MPVILNPAPVVRQNYYMYTPPPAKRLNYVQMDADPDKFAPRLDNVDPDRNVSSSAGLIILISVY